MMKQLLSWACSMVYLYLAFLSSFMVTFSAIFRPSQDEPFLSGRGNRSTGMKSWHFQRAINGSFVTYPSDLRFSDLVSIRLACKDTDT